MEREQRGSIAPFLIGAGVGATVMCLLDPSTGRRRRAILQDKSRHYANVARTEAGKATRDFGNRMTGARHRATSLLHRESADDEVVANRVRSALGRATSHARAIDIDVEDGVVRLCGAVAEGEADRIVRHAQHVAGVKRVESRLAPTGPSEERTSQDEGRRGWLRGTREWGREWLRGGGRQVWNPSTRAAGALAGLAALSWAVARRTPATAAAGATGAALLTRSLVNRPISRIVGAKDRGDAVRVRKTLSVDAPAEQVYRLWSHPELFPRFLTHVKSVERVGDGRYHWVATGPGGVDVDWDAELTEMEPNRRLSWRSLEGSEIENHGTVHLEPEANGGTRIHVDMSYGPPAGLLGHSVAWLTRQDPRTAMNDDLLRMKSLLEDGRTTARGEMVTLDDLLASA